VPVSFLTEEQERRYGRYAGEPSPEQLARYFHLDDADRAFVAERRGGHMRLGCAVQLGTVRFLGTFLEAPADVPPRAVRFIADQIGLATDGMMAEYAASRWRIRHPAEIRERYGYQPFSNPFVQFRLNRWLYALCWTGSDRPSGLFDRATAWLIGHKVLLPGVTTLERNIARVRARAAQRLWRQVVAGITSDQRERLESLLVPPEGARARQSSLDRLRDGPVLQSPAELARAVERLDEVRLLAAGMPDTARLPRTRVLALARFAAASKAHAVARLPDNRRIATLVAFVRTLEATAQDDVLDLFDIVVTRIFADALNIGREARMRGLRDLDAAALTLSQGWGMLLEQGDGDPRGAVFAAFPREAIEAAMARVDALVRPADDPYFDELLAQHRRIRRFLPGLVRVAHLGATPAARPLLTAVEHLREVEGRGATLRRPPIEFVPESWRSRVIRDGEVDPKAWTLCLVERMRASLRRRDLFTAPSLRYADPRAGLLDGAAWESARPAVCRTLGVSGSGPEETARMAARLDAAYRATAGRLPENASVRIETALEGTAALSLSALDKLDEPASLVALRSAVAARLPRVDLPELLLEMHARTGFAAEFTHASERGARAGDLPTSICAVLLAEACNTGLEPLIRLDTPALRRSRLSWVRQNYVRAETLIRANAALVVAQAAIPLARAWGGGDVASADGLRFVVPVRTIHSGPNPRYFGQERGVTYYNLTSDQFTGLGGIVVPGTLRDSLVLLSVLLEQETVLQPTEIMTDTGAYTDIMFGIFHLLGFQFSPRLADVSGARFWRVDPKADYGALNGLARHRAKMPLVVQNWDDLLRLAGSLKLGLVQAGGLMRTLQTNDRPTKLARALEEWGRVVKSLYMLSYIDDESYRRRILVQLNRGEGRHQLARAVFHGKRGELRQRYREGQEDQLGALGLLVNVIVLWNSLYMDAALNQLRAEGYEVRDEDVARLSPLGFEHINMLGRYAFTLPETVARGEMRPLRNPASPSDETDEPALT
jgi:TnpA family transposase